MKKINIFVSSTCYDLSQIRSDLHDYISDNGHNPILSELNSFPINPYSKTVDSCIEAVKNNADIFILVIGNRYGSLVETGKSITNTEFLAAKSKGIPIYIFIDKRILNILPIWLKNKDGNYNEIVDSIKIFEFVNELRSDLNLWTFEFEKAQDIIFTLKNQLSYLFKESLTLSTKYKVKTNDFFLENLSNEALRIYLEKSDSYESSFFYQTLIDEIKKKESIKMEYDYQIYLDSKYVIYDNEKLIDWLRQRFLILTNQINSLNLLLHDAFREFYGEDGIPANLKGFYYLSVTYAKIFESIINWTIETASASVNDECQSLINKLSLLSKNAIINIWQFPFEQKDAFEKIKERSKLGQTNLSLKSILTIDIDPIALNDYRFEFEKFSKLILKK